MYSVPYCMSGYPQQNYSLITDRMIAIGSVLTAVYTVGLRGDVRGEWDETKQHDVLFLLTVQPPDQIALGAIRDRGDEPTPAQKHGLIYVRGAEVIEVRHMCTRSPPVHDERCTDKTEMHDGHSKEELVAIFSTEMWAGQNICNGDPACTVILPFYFGAHGCLLASCQGEHRYINDLHASLALFTHPNITEFERNYETRR